MNTAARIIGTTLNLTAAPLPGLTKAAVERLWYSPPPRPRGVASHPALARARKQQFDTPTGPLAGLRWGEGPSVLMLHGWGSWAARFAPVAEDFVKAGFSVLAIDMPGHGDSPRRRTDLFEISDALLRIIEREPELVGVVGHSFGGLVAMQLITMGLKPLPVAVVAAPSSLDTVVHAFRLQLGLGDAPIALLHQHLVERFGIDVRHRLDMVPSLKGHSAPILAIHDRDDPEVPIESARRLLMADAVVELHETEGLGHRTVMRDADVIARILRHLDGKTA